MRPIVQALLATCFTYLLTAFGSSLVFCVDTRGNEGRASQVMAVAAGMMLAAVTELLTSCAEMSHKFGVWSFLPLAVGFFIACSMMMCMDACLMRSAESTLPGGAPPIQATGYAAAARASPEDRVEIISITHVCIFLPFGAPFRTCLG